METGIRTRYKVILINGWGTTDENIVFSDSPEHAADTALGQRCSWSSSDWKVESVQVDK